MLLKTIRRGSNPEEKSSNQGLFLFIFLKGETMTEAIIEALLRTAGIVAGLFVSVLAIKLSHLISDWLNDRKAGRKRRGDVTQ